MLKRRIAILSLICRDFLASPYIDHDTKHQATRWWWITMRIEHFVRSSLYRISRTAFYAHWAMIKCLTFYLEYNCKRTTITNLTAQTTSRMLLMLKMPQVLLSGIKKSNVNKSHSDSSLLNSKGFHWELYSRFSAEYKYPQWLFWLREKLNILVFRMMFHGKGVFDIEPFVKRNS